MRAPVSKEIPQASLHVKGAREHNLKNVDLSIPRDALVVFTGLSGSGKSSLAFDTIYQEGQRRFMESLSAYARQFLGKMEKPQVDLVEGLSPTLSIDQRTVSKNPRSTVGTITEILDHLRLLMARLGTPHCPECDAIISALSPVQIADSLLEVGAGARTMILAPIVRERKGEYRKELAALREEGWVRVRIDGEVRRLEEDIVLGRYEKHTIEVIIDRTRAVPEERYRVIEGVERALKMAKGVVNALVETEEGLEHHTWSADRACTSHPKLAVPELEPRFFSFNAPQGACQLCNGLGALESFEPSLMVDENARIPECVRVFGDSGKIPFTSITSEIFKDIAKRSGANLRKKWKDQSPEVIDCLLTGGGRSLTYKSEKEQGDRKFKDTRAWRGLVPTMEHIYHFTKHKGFHPYRLHQVCLECDGARLSRISLAVRFREQNIHDLCALSITDAREFFDGLHLKGTEEVIGEAIVREIRERLLFLDKVGLGYLSLDRSAPTLSGGEAQRIRLAAQVGSGLQGVTYILDEPSIGLHSRDNQRLLETLGALRDRGNSVLVVEHDEDTMAQADWVVDIGPGAGVEGGRILASCPPAELLKAKSLTAAYLRGDESIPVPAKRRKGNGKFLKIRGATAHNLKEVDVDIPLGQFVVFTGVSGSGKSTLMHETLRKALARDQDPKKPMPKCRDFQGGQWIDKVIVINQSPIGRTPRSNPATYTGLFDGVRKLFATTPEARIRGYKPGRFSFNVTGGRCEECSGAGLKTIEMQFLADVQVTCESCNGRRFNQETLEVRYRGKNISDVLNMPIKEAAEFFTNHRKLKQILETLVRVGMGYVKLGQPSTTLSGGEAQRIKLASELHRPATGQTLYLLDEPTTGLHVHDVRALLASLNQLVDAGNTVLVIEHNTDVMKVADHLIDLGPEGGDGGGLIIGQGTPEKIAKLDTPTGQVLARLREFGSRKAPTPHLEKSPKAKDLIIEGATCHNLKGVNVRIPRGSFTVITGVSGSGKSSLAFHTIFSEGQRRYVECLSTYARRFLGRINRAPVEKMEGLAPAIAIQQKTASHNPRSTVATVTEIYDYLRLLWARIGEPHCHHCNQVLEQYSPSLAAKKLHDACSDRGWLIAKQSATPIPQERASQLIQEGFARVLSSDFEEHRLEDKAAEKVLKKPHWLVIDRFRPEKASQSRLSEAFRGAYDWGENQARFVSVDGKQFIFTEFLSCSTHGQLLNETITPRHLSFNAHQGACKSCDGLGSRTDIDPERLLPHPKKALFDALDARVASVFRRSKKNTGRLKSLYAHLELDWETPVAKLKPSHRKAILYGLPGITLEAKWAKRWGRTRRSITETFEWNGVIGVLTQWKSQMKWLKAQQICRNCGGGRLRPESLAIQIGGLSISQLCAMTVQEALTFWEQIHLQPNQAVIADQARREVMGRLRFLLNVGLDYLSLDRNAASLSGGESQRIRLASQLGSGLTGCLYVLDEPTIGLHPRDTQRLIESLKTLQNLGNTLVVVEHDPDTMFVADQIIDMGPGAGEDGGTVVAAGSYAEILAHPNSLTGAYLSGAKSIPRPKKRRKGKGKIQLKGCDLNNLQDLRATIPLGTLTVVTGVSGSGKSSLIMDTLVPALKAHKRPDVPPAPCDSIKLPSSYTRLSVVNQRPISRNPRSTAATTCQVMDPIRTLFSQSKVSKERGWSKSHFSFNHKAGRCPRCEGRSAILIEMHFLSDVWVRCETCRGRRYAEPVLDARWRGQSIADVLDLRVKDALEVFHNHRRIRRPLEALNDVGLGYLRLGQPLNTLSGGEAQRIKLSRELVTQGEGAVYVLDEPTTGLHFADIEKLIAVLHRLVDAGGTVIVVEHNPEVIANADHVIDMGPEGGLKGGAIVADGTPEEVALTSTHTALALRTILGDPS
jgi:excinuclease ABC subunit A